MTLRRPWKRRCASSSPPVKPARQTRCSRASSRARPRPVSPIRAAPATAVRYGVGPRRSAEALAPMIKRPGEALPLLPTDKALQAYRRAAALDPNEPWTWLAHRLDGGRRPGGRGGSRPRAAARSGRLSPAVMSKPPSPPCRDTWPPARGPGPARRCRRALAEAVKLSEMHAQETPDALENVALSLGELWATWTRRGDMAEAASAFEHSWIQPQPRRRCTGRRRRS